MTATTSENGIRTRLQRIASGTVAFAIVLGACSTGTTSAFGADATEAVELYVSAGVRGTVAPETATTAAVTIQNDSKSELAAGQVVLELNRTPLTDDAAVTAWLDDAEAPGEFDEIASDSAESVDAESSASTNILIPQEQLTGLAAGVYPLRATLSEATDDVTTASVLVVAEASATQVAVIVPITATSAAGGLLTADELSALTADDGALTAQLDGVAGTSAILAIDPSILAAIRALGSSAPAQAVQWMLRLDALPNERFSLQFGDADAATQAQAGLTALLQPTTLAPFVDAENFASAPTLAPTAPPTDAASPSPAPTTGPALPDDTALTTLAAAPGDVMWPYSALSTTDLATFDTYLGVPATTILPSDVLGDTTAAHVTVDGHDVLAVDSAASDALSDAAGESDPEIRQSQLAIASARLYLAGLAGTPVLIGLDRDENRTSDALNEAVATADTAGFGLTALRATPAVAGELTATPDATRAASLQRMLDSETVLGQFATILEDPQLLLSPKRIQILRSTGAGLSASKFADAVAAVEAATITTLDSVDIPPSSTIQLLSANADLPFSVRNDLPWPITMQLHVSPSDPRLDVQLVTPVVIQAHTTSRVKVPVSARVGSGELSLRLQLYSPTGVQISQPESVRVAVRAEWETIGLIVFSSLIVLLIGLGVVRTIRRKRREADAETGEDAADKASTEGAASEAAGE